tara:strand:- start:10726 stop:11499 length:774 start_codon:yes stop_codon:yes gene_type:complete
VIRSKLKLFYKKNKQKSRLIIFIHGAACDHTLWVYQSRYFFNKNFSTITLDLPGHGTNTSKPLNSIKAFSNLIKQLIKNVSYNEIYLIGHSMGSLICLDTALAKLKPIKRIFLIGVSYPMNVNKNLLLKSKCDQNLAIKDMISWSLSDKIKLNGSNLIGLNLPNFINVIMSNSKTGLLYKDLYACNNFIMKEDEIKKIKTPITIISGDSDIMTPKKIAKNLHDRLSVSNFEVINDAGHFQPLENPIELNKIILKYVK